MKYPPIICILFLLSLVKASASDSARIYHLTKIPEEGLVLNKGWVYQPGDDKNRASVIFDDATWSPMDPTAELHHLPDVRKSEIGWFRLRIHVDSSLYNQTFAFVVSGLGASEIYFNGKLLYNFGRVSTNYNDEETRYFTNKLLSLRLDSQAIQLMAIRHSFNHENLYLKFTFERPIQKIVLKRIDQGFADHVKDNNFDATLRSIQVSFYLPLGFLLLFLFWSFRPRKEYLYSGVFCFSMFAAILMHIFALSESNTVTSSNVLLYTTQVLYIIGALSFLISTYILFQRKKSPFFYFILAYGLVSLALYFFNYDLSGLFNAVFFPLINLELLRISFLAFRKRRKGAGILFITSLLLNLSLVLYVIFTINSQVVASAYLQSISFIIPGIGLSLFYAGEFARTAADLHQRAIEVEQLSHEKLAQEKEKQQILSAQNETLEKKVSERTAELSKSLNELKETQAMLFQREKMASLGELTAGIAHEIQNPLNFVNNFSEINAELIGELQQEIDNGDFASVKSISVNIKDNFEKITQHGKRADGIVKSMLLHSRHAGSKEHADLNALLDEYFRLAYHGLRAKDKSFNAEMKTDFDPTIGKIKITPPDIGRVMLNLITNSFYALREKTRIVGDGYLPAVTVSTRKSSGKIEIIVKDNGTGIPGKVVGKIFQPFFTTKPTGQGTGLGLSLSYDIIQAHGGNIEVKSKEGEGTEFIISVPSDSQ